MMALSRFACCPSRQPQTYHHFRACALRPSSLAASSPRRSAAPGQPSRCVSWLILYRFDRTSLADLRSVASDIADWYPTLCFLSGVSGSDDPPRPPSPVSMDDQHRDIYGTDSFPPVVRLPKSPRRTWLRRAWETRASQDAVPSAEKTTVSRRFDVLCRTESTYGRC